MKTVTASFSQTAPLQLSPRMWWTLVAAFPIVLTVVYLALLASSATRPFAVLMTLENYPFELATFGIALVVGVQSLSLAKQFHRAGAHALWRCFYIFLGALFIWIGLEEVDYGQWFFHWATPEALSRINTQKEFNLHNIQGLGGNTEYLRLAFGLAGLTGIAMSRWPAFRLVSVPPILLTWFAVITALAAGDLYCDLRALDNNLSKAMDVMSEVVELIIVMAMVLYLYLASQRLPMLSRRA